MSLVGSVVVASLVALAAEAVDRAEELLAGVGRFAREPLLPAAGEGDE